MGGRDAAWQSPILDPDGQSSTIWPQRTATEGTRNLKRPRVPYLVAVVAAAATATTIIAVNGGSPRRPISIQARAGVEQTAVPTTASHSRLGFVPSGIQHMSDSDTPEAPYVSHLSVYEDGTAIRRAAGQAKTEPFNEKPADREVLVNVIDGPTPPADESRNLASQPGVSAIQVRGHNGILAQPEPNSFLIKWVETEGSKTVVVSTRGVSKEDVLRLATELVVS